MALDKADTAETPQPQLRDKLAEVQADGEPGVWYRIREYGTPNTASITASTANARWAGLEIRASGKMVYARVIV